MSEYIEFMSNLREAFRKVRSVMPEVFELARKRADITKDGDLEIVLLSDIAWDKLQDKYYEVEPKIYQFNPDEEYGVAR